MVRLILHPCDFSASALAALGVACGLAREQAAAVLVVHVVRPEERNGSTGVLRTHRQIRESWYALQQLREQQRNVWLEPVLQRGRPAEVILEAAQETQCDLIVMGIRKAEGKASRLGSVAREVVQRANCAVLCVRPPPAFLRAAPRRSRAMPARRVHRFSRFDDAEAC